MSTLRNRTPLGRTSINADQNLPPSPRSINTPTLSQIVGKQVPTLKTTPLTPLKNDPEIIKSLNDSSLLSQQSLSQIVENRSIDEELAKNGYTPISKIIVMSNNDNSQVSLIKTQNDIGEPFYVEVDTDEFYISQSPNDPKFKTVDNLKLVSRQEKDIAFTQAGLSVAGVAIECNDGLCTIMHDSKGKAPIEKNYSLINKIKNNNDIIATYPIIKLNDIKINPNSVKKNIENALRKMRNASLKACLKEVELVQRKFDHLCHLFKEVSDLRSKIIKEFHYSMTVLENSLDKHVKCSDKNTDKIKQIAFNIEKRNSKFPYLIESCKEVSKLDLMIDNVTKSLAETKNLLEKKFKHIHCVYELKDKRKHCGCVWDKEDHDDEDHDHKDF